VKRVFPYVVTAFACVALSFGASSVCAQTGQMFGELVGKAADSQGGVLPGVTVTLSGPALMGEQSVVTNDHGQYRFPAVTTGTYKLTFEMGGFATLVREGIIVSVRNTITVDVVLQLASLTESVTVSGSSPVIDIENTKVGARLDSQILGAIPTQRTIFGATTMLPGMVMGTQDVAGLYSGTSTGMVAHGATQYNLNYFGVSTDTPQNYGQMYYMDYGSAEEIAVDTAAMGAEIGGPGGANINIIPKSGGNDLKGTLYFTGTNKGMVGDNVDDALRAQGITAGTRVKKLLDLNADAGGPFFKDRAWWFGSIRQYNTSEQVIGFPIDFDTELRNYLTRATFKLTQNNNLSAFWTFNRKGQPNRGAALNQPPESTWRQLSDKNLENLNWTTVFGPNTFNEVSTSMFHMFWPTYYSDAWYSASPQPSFYDTATDVYWGAHPQGERIRDSYRWQLNDAMTHYRDGLIGGNHQMKFGFETWQGWGTEGHMVYGDTAYRLQNGAPFEIRAYNTPLEQATHMRNFAGFANDRITYSRVTVSVGLRYTFFDGYLPEQTGGGGRWFPARVFPQKDAGYNWQRFLPRTGLVYKLTADSKNVLKLSYGRYMENMYTAHFADIVNENVLRTAGMATYTWFGDLNGNGVVDANEYNPVAKSQFVPANNRIDPNWNSPITDEATIGYQRDLANDLGFTVSWVQRWFKDDYADVNVGIPVDGYTPHVFTDPGPDNLINTADDRQITMFDVLPQYQGKEAYVRQTVPGTSARYKGLELSMNKRMSNRWQLMASYVWSRLNGVIWADSEWRQTQDPNNPNTNIASNKYGREAYDQPHAVKIIGSYVAPFDINLGVNYQYLTGMPTDREFRGSLKQGSTTIRAEERGTYRADPMNLLSFRANKRFKLGGAHAVSGFFELHNLLNTNAAQTLNTLTQAFKSQAEFDSKRSSVAYFGRDSVIIAPRVAKVGLKFEF
jgi:carboxypeptidase family protein